MNARILAKQALFTAAAALLAIASACGGAAPKVEVPEPPKPPTEPVAWIPKDVSIVARVRLEPWRKTPLWGVWDQKPSQGPSWSDVVELGLIDEIAAGGHAERGQDPLFVAALRGRFGAGYLDKVATEKHLTAEPPGELSFYQFGDTRWTQISPALIVLCSPDQMGFVTSRMTHGPDAEVKDGTLFTALGQRLSFDSADLAVLAQDATGEKQKELARRRDQLGVARLAKDILRAGLSVDLGPEVVLAAAAEAGDEAGALSLRGSLDETLSTLSRNLFVGMLGLRPIVSALQPTSEGAFVVVRGAVPEAEIQKLMSKAASMLEVAAQQQGGLVIPGL